MEDIPLPDAHPVSAVDGEDVVEDPQAVEDGDCEPKATFFKESEECRLILESARASLPVSWDVVVSNCEPIVASLGQFEKYLQEYQEVPQLVKHHLGDLVGPLMEMVAARLPPSTVIADAFKAKSQGQGTGTSTSSAEDSAAPQKTSSEAAATSITQTTDSGVVLEYDVYDVDAPKTPLHHLCRALYVVVKVAGPKCCTSHFPHDVKLFENVCYALMYWQRTPMLRREWEVRYCLLLWLSNLILVPFAIHTIDSSLVGETGVDGDEQASTSLAQQLMHLAYELLSDTSRCREAAAVLVARMLARTDGGANREDFFAKVERWLHDANVSSVRIHGILQAVATTLKLGKRREMLPFAPRLIPLVCSTVEAHTGDTKLCKTAVKVVQRLGLCLLKQQQAPWRYVKNVASLEVNLALSLANGQSYRSQGDGQEDPQGGSQDKKEAEDEEDPSGIECGDGLEEVIGVLIDALSHPDTVVRWSAAKGMGRLCNRLPKDMADDVVDAFTQVFNVYENDAGWHGGMLAVAELCRRSILLPSRFDAIVPVIARGLVYDLSRGTYSVGSHVRDAACYVCWSVARAYNAVDLEPYVSRLSTTLVISALFDREVNVRRAASAALQECVGRLGNFPHGIDLVTTIDFFNLATMRGSFLHVAPLVAKFDAYRLSMIEALVHVKLVHWDKEVRRTAARSLGLLAPICTSYITEHVVSEVLLPRVRDATLSARHGAISGIAECIANVPSSAWTREHIAAFANIIPFLDSGRHFRGRGGEFIRQACLRLLEAAAEAQIVLPELVEVEKVSGEKIKARTLGRLQLFYEDTWKQILEWLQCETVESYRIFARHYYPSFQEGFHGKVMNQLLESAGEGKGTMIERRGTILAIGAIPPPLLMGTQASSGLSYFSLFQTALSAAVKPEANVDARDAETRRNAILSMAKLMVSLDGSQAVALVTPLLWSAFLKSFLSAFDDYAVDKRGDVGSFVRVQAILSSVDLLQWASQRAAEKPDELHFLWHIEDVVTPLLGRVLQQATEKIDKVRGTAGQALYTILSHNTVMEHLRRTAAATANPSLQHELDVLHRCVVLSNVVDWSSPNELFAVLAPPLLQTIHFAENVLEGIVVSVGGLSVHVLKPSLQSLIDAIKLSSDGGVHISAMLVRVAAKHVHDDRFVVPLCVTIDRLINVNLFDEERWMDLVDIVICETKHYSTDIQKLLPLVGVLGTLCRAQRRVVREAAWHHALIMIASRYPKVRSKMGTDFYTALLFITTTPDFVGVVDAHLNDAMEHLSRTTWDDTSAPKVRGARNELYAMLNLAKPDKDNVDMRAETQSNNRLQPNSYKYLVHEAGY